jgi:hypothetical protein
MSTFNRFAHDLKRRYGLTMTRYTELASAQAGLCAICQDRGPLTVDHDHLSGEVRGLLCHLCNTGIGKLNDSPALLSRAIDYLHNPPARILLEPPCETSREAA